MALVMSRMQIWLYVMLLTRPPRLSSDFTRMPLKIRGRRIAPNRSRIGVDGEVVDTDVLNSAGHHAIVGRVVPVSFGCHRHAVAVPKWLCATTSSDTRWPPLIAIWSSPGAYWCCMQ